MKPKSNSRKSVQLQDSAVWVLPVFVNSFFRPAVAPLGPKGAVEPGVSPVSVYLQHLEVWL